MSRFIKIFILTALLTSWIPSLQAQRYQVGDIVENFTLTNRATNQPVSLYDLEGKVIFLEWFAYWCPFCQAAANAIGPGLIDYYPSQNGNPDGVEFMHVALNLQAGAESSTQNFINFYQLPFVLNDFNRAVANRFQSNGQPIFAIINGVENSASHEQWELIYSRLGYGDLSAPITEFRNAINTVKAAQVVPGFVDYLNDLQLPENQRAEEDDPDFDGIPNVLEYFFGTDASDTASFSRPVNKIMSVGSVDYQILEFIRNPEATDVTVVPQFSFSPGFESLIGNAPFSTEPIEGGLEKVRIRSNIPLGTTSEFSRLVFVSESQ